MLALEFETVRDVALAIVAGSVVLAVVLTLIAKALATKALALALFAGFAVAVWSQRASLDECAGTVAATLSAGARDDTTCTFFGRDVTVTSPLG